MSGATSPAGLHFTVDPGTRLATGYVDPSVVQLKDGSWLMAVSRTPGEQQRLFLAHFSADEIEQLASLLSRLPGASREGACSVE